MAKGWTVISVRQQLQKDLERVWEADRKRPGNQAFTSWMDELLQKYVEFNEDLRLYGPFLEFKDADQNMITLYDHQKNRSITVFIDGSKKRLHCDADKVNDCLHVGFCFAIPEVYRVLIRNGFKEPRPKNKL